MVEVWRPTSPDVICHLINFGLFNIGLLYADNPAVLPPSLMAFLLSDDLVYYDVKSTNRKCKIMCKKFSFLFDKCFCRITLQKGEWCAVYMTL